MKVKAAVKTKKPINNPHLKSWVALNDFMRVATEEECQKLLKEEKKGRARVEFVKRIYSRLNKVRAARERTALVESVSS